MHYFTRLEPHVAYSSNFDPHSFFQAEVDSEAETIMFVDLYFGDENRFFRFCDKLSLYSELKDLSMIYINNFSSLLMNNITSDYFYKVLKNLSSLERVNFKTNNLSRLDLASLKKLLEQLVEMEINSIDLSGNQFTLEQIQVIKEFEKKHTDRILLNLNLPVILNKFKLCNNIQEYRIIPFLQKKPTLYHVSKALSDRLIRNGLLSSITSNLNSASIFEQYICLNGGNKAKAGALIKKYNY